MKVNANHRLLADNGRPVPFIASPNKGGKLSGNKPTFLIIHYTAGGPASGTISWFKNPDADASAHLVIDRNGDVTQMVNFDTVAWHAGRSSWNGISGLNSHSVGIELCNWGLLNGQSGNWKTRTGRPMPDDRVRVAKHKNFEPQRFHGWEIFDEPQFHAGLAAAKAILKAYAIPLKNVLGHDDISPGRKQDPGPAFDMASFKALLEGRRNDQDDLFEVNNATGLNLRRGPSTDHEILERMPNGTKLRQIGSDGPWVEAARLNESGQIEATGWCHGSYLREL